MPISEDQLAQWAQPVATQDVGDIVKDIKSVLDQDAWPRDAQFELFLQGSYADDTNIYSDTDLDLIVNFNCTYTSNLSDLQRRAMDYANASHRYEDVRMYLKHALQEYYDLDPTTPTEYILRITTGKLPLAVNFLPCIEYRYFIEDAFGEHFDGIAFMNKDFDDSLPNDRAANSQELDQQQIDSPPSEPLWIFRFPQFDLANGQKKDNDTNSHYKPIIRIFKNIRAILIAQQAIGDNIISSYHLECLLYNVPNKYFTDNYSDTVFKILDWLSTAPLDKFLCKNRRVYLFGDNPGQWSSDKAILFIEKTIEFWNSDEKQ